MIHLIFIDSVVKDSDLLRAHINPGAIAHSIAKNINGIEYIAQTLVAQRRSLTDKKKRTTKRTTDITISIVAHGRPGVLELGNAVLSMASLRTYRDRIQKWFSSTPLDICSCDRLQLYSGDTAGTESQELLHGLHQVTYATVYAFTPQSGKSQKWNNWQLDTVVNTWNKRLFPLFGHMQTPPPQYPFNLKNIAAYSTILTVPVGNTRTDKLLPT